MNYPPKAPIKQPPIKKTSSLKDRRWFDAFIMGSIDPIVVFDENLDIKFTNQSGSALFRKSVTDLIGLNIEACGALGSIIAPVLNEVIKNNIGVNCDHEIPDEKNKRIFQGSYSPVLNIKKETLGIFSVLREVTDRRNIVKQLKASNKRLEAHTKALEIFDIVSESDLSGTILYVNDKFCENSHYARKDLVGQNYRVINSNTHTKFFFQELWETISRGQPWFGEIKNRRKDGSFFWAQTIITPIFNDQGKISRFLSLQQDITDERDEKFKVAGSALRFRQILDSSPYLEVTLDLDQNITFCNKNFLDKTGYLEVEVFGKNWFDVFMIADEKAATQAEFLKVFSSLRRPSKIDFQLLVKNGQKRNKSWKLAVMKNMEGLVYGIHLLGEEKKTSTAFTSGVQQDVLGFVSHELKGGLISIESGLNLIQENFGTPGFDDSYLKATVNKLLNKVTRIRQISHDTMRNLEIIALPMKIKSQPISLRTILLGVWTQIQEDVLLSKNLEFNLQIPEQDIVVQWDPLKIEQAERNLLSNAIQYSKPEGGKITLSAKKQQDNILISVADEGVGMPAASVEFMFNAFTRGVHTNDQTEKHYGIGLKLCKDIVAQHRGHIWVESQENVGTTVFFLIPVNPEEMKFE